MNSAKRVEKYLIRRDGMRCYDNVVHGIDAGEPTEGWLTANDIASVLKQRAELLEALNGMHDIWVSTCSSMNWDPHHLHQFTKCVDALKKVERD